MIFVNGNGALNPEAVNRSITNVAKQLKRGRADGSWGGSTRLPPNTGNITAEMLSDWQGFSQQVRFLIEALRIPLLTYILESTDFGGGRRQLGKTKPQGTAAKTSVGKITFSWFEPNRTRRCEGKSNINPRRSDSISFGHQDRRQGLYRILVGLLNREGLRRHRAKPFHTLFKVVGDDLVWHLKDLSIVSVHEAAHTIRRIVGLAGRESTLAGII